MKGLVLAALIVLLLVPLPCASGERFPLEPLDTSGPGATLYGFLDAVDGVIGAAKEDMRGHPSYSRYLRLQRRITDAIRALDLSEIAPVSRRQAGVAASIFLYEVLSRIDLPPRAAIPGAKSFEEDETAEYVIPHTEITLVRKEGGPRAGEFLFSADTVARAGEFYDRISELPYKRKVALHDLVGYMANHPGWMVPEKVIQGLPAWMRDPVLGFGLWKWTGLVILVLLIAGLLLLIHRIIKPLSGDRSVAGYLRRLVVPLSLMALMVVLVKVSNVYVLGFAGDVAKGVVVAAAAVTFVAGAWVAWLLPLTVAEWIIAMPSVPEEGLNAHLLRLVARIIGILLAIVVIFYGAHLISVPLVGLLAGVSVGGLAIALATQDTLKNLLGSLMIYMDKPYEVGHRINVKGHDGVVEEIGLRSTKIRLLSGPVTTVPNERMASEDVVNVSRRPFIQRLFNVRIANDTPPEKVGRALEILRDVLSVPATSGTGSDRSAGKATGGASPDDTAQSRPHPNEAINRPDFPPRVYFNDLAQDYLNILVIYWYHPPAYWEYLEHATRVNARIVERLDEEGIAFAMPSQKLYMADEGNSWPADQGRQAAEGVPESGEHDGG